MCIFCKILNKEIEAQILWENEEFILINDKYPKESTHMLLISKEHIPTLNDASGELIGRGFEAIKKIVKENSIETGYNVKINCGNAGGQEIFHLHFHILSGLKL